MHPSDDDLRLYSLLRLPVNQSKTIQLHLLGCEECQRRMSSLTRQGEASGAFEERKDPRTAAGAPVSVRILNPPGPMLRGWLLEVSKHGLKLALLESLHAGTQVQVRLGKQIVMAQARHCRKHDRGFEVGFEIQDVFLIPGQDTADEDL